MPALIHAADLPLVDTRGAEIQRRLDALNISDREFQERSHIDRKTLRRAIAGDAKVRESTYVAIEAALNRLEEHVRPTRRPASPESDLVTFRLSGNFGVDVVVQGPIDDVDRLEESVERLIRRMREGNDPSA